MKFSGIIWFVILNLGINYSGIGQSICHETPGSIAKAGTFNEIGERIWATTTGLFVQNDQEMRRISLNEKIEGAEGVNWGIQKLPNQEYLICYIQSGLVHYASDTSIMLSLGNSKDQGLINTEIYEMLPYGDTVFLATKLGLSIYSISQKKELQLVLLTDFFNNKSSLLHPNLIRAIQYDQSNPNLIWGCGAQGIFAYDFKNNDLQIHRFDKSLIHPAHQKNYNIDSYLLMDLVKKRNQFYCTSWGGGLINFDLNTGKWHSFLFELQTDIKDNLENVPVNLLSFNDSLLLVTAYQRPPYFFNTNKNEIVDFEVIMGETVDQIKSDALIIDPPFVWISYANRICRYLIPKKYQQKDKTQYVNKIFLTKTKNRGFSFGDLQGLIYVAPANFDRDYRSPTFHFATTGFTQPAEINFEYRLSPFDKDWQIAGNNNQISYPQLAGGRYTLDVRTLAEEEYVHLAPYTFQIEKYFWEQWWFYALLLLAFALIAGPLYYYFRKLRNEKLQAELKHKAKLHEAELSALRAQMNPHFLFNSLASINQYIMYEDPRTASKYLAKFSHLMRRILNNSQKKLISLDEELNTLELYTEMENIRFDEKFNFSIVVDPTIDISNVFLPTMILQPFLENAILHGLVPKEEKGNLLLLIKQLANKSIKIIIEDNGIGRDAASKISKGKVEHNDSLGLKITNNRLDLINQAGGIKTELDIEDLYTEEGKACGTRVSILLPLINTKIKSLE